MGQTASALARTLLTARATSTQLAPCSSTDAGFDMAQAYAVSAEVLKLRVKQGEVPCGRKIGFTNRNIWNEYRVSAPIWGYMTDRTVRFARGNAGTQSLKGAMHPKIEPEIVLGLKRAPTPKMSEAQLAACIEWVAHGYETVDSVFPQWKFQAADTVAGFGMHGTLIIGDGVKVGRDTDALVNVLKTFSVSLSRNGNEVATGSGTNVLGSPLLALQHLVEDIARRPGHAPLKAGDIITTGTLTAAFDICAGETWQTRFTGIDLPGLTLDFV
jgi:2-keto-4-pentenoate hydratase